MSSKRGALLAITAVTIAVFAGAGAYLATSSTPTSAPAKTLCVPKWPGECEMAQFETLAETDPAAALVEYQNQSQTNQQLREQCHGVFHAIGNGAARGNKDTWAIFMLGNGECNWGYIHGIVEQELGESVSSAVARAESLCVPPAKYANDQARAELVGGVRGNCVHGTGHALFKAAQTPIEAEQGCRDAFSENADELSCIDGMIMEFGGSDAARNGEYPDLCSNIGDDAKNFCYRSIPLTWYNQTGGDYDAVFTRCAEAENDELVDTCVYGAGNLFTAQMGFDLTKSSELCLRQASAQVRQCLLGAVAAGALGLNQGVLSQEELDRFIASSPDPSWAAELREEVAVVSKGFGAAT
jgi:hypothetical protein